MMFAKKLFHIHFYVRIITHFSVSVTVLLSNRAVPGQERKVPRVLCNVSAVQRSKTRRLHQLCFFTVSLF